MNIFTGKVDINIKQIDSYTISFDLNGGRLEAIASQTIPVGALVNKVADPTREVYTFVGWNIQSDGSGALWYFEKSLMPDHDLIVYAQQQEIKRAC